MTVLDFGPVALVKEIATPIRNWLLNPARRKRTQQAGRYATTKKTASSHAQRLALWNQRKLIFRFEAAFHEFFYGFIRSMILEENPADGIGDWHYNIFFSGQITNRA
jgi:hypothetical protein